jgi:hypothetical protein
MKYSATLAFAVTFAGLLCKSAPAQTYTVTQTLTGISATISNVTNINGIAPAYSASVNNTNHTGLLTFTCDTGTHADGTWYKSIGDCSGSLSGYLVIKDASGNIVSSLTSVQVGFSLSAQGEHQFEFFVTSFNDNPGSFYANTLISGNTPLSFYDIANNKPEGGYSLDHFFPSSTYQWIDGGTVTATYNSSTQRWNFSVPLNPMHGDAEAMLSNYDTADDGSSGSTCIGKQLATITSITITP